MIVRILGEGQFDVPDADIDHLNDLDDELQAAVEAGDPDRFTAALGRLLDRVREHARPHALDDLVASDVVLPGPDSSLQEVVDLLADDGLIPG
jgi:predicted transcriptional regulator